MTRGKARWVGAAAFLLAVIGLAAIYPSATLNRLAALDSHQSEAAVPYGPLPRQRLDVYAPRGDAPNGGHPVVVFSYGGSWNRGERADYRFVGEALAARGVLTLVADYRLYPEVHYPDFLADCALALGYGLREASRLGGNHASPSAPRSFIAAPLEDSFVNPQRSSVGLATKLRSAGVHVELKLYARVDHQSLIAAFAGPLNGLAPVLDDAVGFISQPQ